MITPKRHGSETTTVETHLSSAAPGSACEEFLRSGNAARVLSERAASVDEAVTSAARQLLLPASPRGLAVLAVGGYGRRELFPHSDVDLLLLTEKSEPGSETRAALSVFIQKLWDSRLRLSHSVRTVSDCSELHEQNIELNISLLDERFLIGDEELHGRLTARMPKFIDGQRQALARHLCRLTRQRHAQHHDTIYHLEPNVKESPGGLRDLHFLWWLDRLRPADSGAQPWLTGLEASRDFLHALRCFLHFRAGRDNNQLSFDAQEEIVEQPFLPFEKPEAWMREYFRHVRAVHRATLRALETVESKGNSLLAGFRDWRSRLSNADFTVSRDRIFLKSPHQMEHDPMLVMRLFQFVARHGVQLSLDAERRLEEAVPHLAEWFVKPQALWPALKEGLALPCAAQGLRTLHNTGVLGAIFPEWRRIECCVVRDFYHRYTVDEHTLVAVQNLDDLGVSAEPGHRRFANLLKEIEDLAALRFAMLFHDAGKGDFSGEHVSHGVALADQAMERIGTPAASRVLARFLIERHLELSAAMTGRDLDDPATARVLADRVGTLERLKYLTLVTFADIGAVNPSALTPWRLEQLWRVYLTAYRELTRELDTDRIQTAPADPPERAEFLKGLPRRYLRTHSAEEIEKHVRLDRMRAQAEVALDIEKKEGVYQLTVLAKDRVGLFASVAGALSSFGMNIVKAEAFANQQGTIVDTFSFTDPQRTLDLNPPEMDRLRHTMERVLLGRANVKDLLKYRPKPAPPSKRSGIDPRVTFDSEASDAATLVEIVSEDRPGLLYDVASALSSFGCNIEVVLVDTEAHKAMDVFYVTINARKLSDAQMGTLAESLRHACQG